MTATVNSSFFALDCRDDSPIGVTVTNGCGGVMLTINVAGDCATVGFARLDMGEDRNQRLADAVMVALRDATRIHNGAAA